MTTALNAGPRQDLSDVMAKLTLQEKQCALRQHPTHLTAVGTRPLASDPKPAAHLPCSRAPSCSPRGGT